MDSSNNEVIHDFPFFKVYKDGAIERCTTMEPALPGLDPDTGVQSKDVVVSPETGVKARIFVPKIDGPHQRLPLLIHYHGGGFCLGSALDMPFKRFLTSLVVKANIVAITIDYRLAPEHHLPIAHEDSWAGLEWVASHSYGQGPEPLLNRHADFGRVFLAGESAGANIAHYVAVQVGAKYMCSLNIVGTLMVHPFFGEQKLDEMYAYMCPTSAGFEEDPILNPALDPNLKMMRSDRVLVCVAEKDGLRNRGVYYYETLKKSEWHGKAEFYQTLGEDHCFHMFNPKSKNVGPFLQKLVNFIKSTK
ncbi:Abhydrolase 3 domain-containing protein [Citrus sinensis]|uniref:2-hydroxyisoflavanone dehydratase-like n=1 Tax=Citrus sinensis TaxID=2711 RepID=UPI0021912DEE|nr:2-hydroxyisoflavanone dehydratase-like [Citrus sinensis]KAH9656170.1 Abhydrolase 3 domain-containing protein [Citrus sinensis]